MKFTITVRVVVDADEGKSAIGKVNDLLKNPELYWFPKYEIITVAAGDKVKQ